MWEVIFLDGTSEDHPAVGRVGGYGVFFRDAMSPVGEVQGHGGTCRPLENILALLVWPCGMLALCALAHSN